MIIGTRGHDLGGVMSAEALAKTAKEKGIESVQLVAYRSLDGVGEAPGFLSHGYAQKVGKAFDKEDVRVALIGCYINLLHADLDRFKEYLRYARDFGCSMVGTETGSVNPDYSFNPDNHGEEAFLQVVEVFKELTSYAQNFGATVGIEAVHCHVVHTPEKMKRILDLVDSPNLRVIFDPVNLITPENYTEAKAIIEKSFDLFGDQIVIVHAKDFIIEEGGMTMVPPGQGLMDYDHLFDTIKQYKYEVDVIIEDYRGLDLDEAIIYLKGI